ncbi:IS3 family transposase [Lactobacillus terrae]|uniref:IS3 family transposase n=1 Tax=Lactobacillus terrae TaxID=2269374 RepID=UPI002481F27F|nr:IS3 family transposase [Lactobacillus terrae]
MNKVRRIMRRQGWNCRVKPKRFKRSINPFQLFDNLVSGNWTSTSPRKLLTTDITYLPFGSSTQYLCSIMDTFNNEVIAYQISNHPNAKLCVDTLEQVTDLAEDCILHSDQGSTFASEIYFECCRKKSITRSMSRLGTPSDNAIIESFHSSPKSETFYYMENQHFSNTIVQNIVREYISDWNESRILTKLGNLSPVQYRELMA